MNKRKLGENLEVSDIAGQNMTAAKKKRIGKEMAEQCGN